MARELFRDGGIWDDVFRVVGNTAVVYFGWAAVTMNRYERTFSEGLNSRDTIVLAGLFGLSYTGFRLGKRHMGYLMNRNGDREEED